MVLCLQKDLERLCSSRPFFLSLAEVFPTRIGWQEHTGPFKKREAGVSALTVNSVTRVPHVLEIIQPTNAGEQSTPKLLTNLPLKTSPINASRLETLLEGHENPNYIVHSFRDGFKLGYSGTRQYQYAPNHKSVIENPDIYLQKFVRNFLLIGLKDLSNHHHLKIYGYPH